ncbi:MAG: M23 family metallopeptidase [Elusimicrobia bacterium]|nr:M23 family metallopeptidase [Elusimicrobiota bacterium]
MIKLLHKILLVGLIISFAVTLNLTATLRKPTYEELSVANLKETSPDYEYIKTLDELVILNHTVTKGEDIKQIALKYGTDVSTIRGINNLESVILKPDQQILVINKKGHIHTVKNGETVETISKKYNVNTEVILIANDMEDDDELVNGEKIFIPGVKIHFSEFLWPLTGCRITSRFGLRRHPIFKDRRFHEGLDLANYFRAPIRASNDGKIIFVGYKSGYGKTIIISHRDGFSTKYGHLNSFLVKKGQYVKMGQIIGKVGSTGNSTGPHLHFEVRKYGRSMNPLKYIGNKLNLS